MIRTLVATALVVVGACGIKGPPKPRMARPEAVQALYRATGATRDEGRVVLAWAMPPAAWADAPKKVLVERHEPHSGDDSADCGKRTIVGRVTATQRIEWSFVPRPLPSGGLRAGVSYRLVAGDRTPLSDSIDTTAARGP